jgi:hypothetical protein
MSEGANFGEYPMTKSDNGIKSQELKNSKEQPAGYTSVTANLENKPSKEGANFGEYPATQSVGLKSTVNAPVENKPNLTTSTGYGATGEYTSVKLENKPSQEGATFAEYPPTQSAGIKSTVSAPVENKPNLTSSTGYNSMEGEYQSSTSSKIENKPSKEGATFAEYPPTQSVGLKSTVSAPVENKPNLTTSTGYGATGEYTSVKLENKPSQEGATFAEYPPTQSVGIKSTVSAPVENKPNLTTSTGYGATGEYTSVNSENKPSLTTSTGYGATGEYTSVKLENKPSQEGVIPTTVNVGEIKTSVNQTKTEYNSMTGGYSSSSTTNNVETKNTVNQSQTPVLPLIVQVPANAPIINNPVPLGNVQASVTYKTITTTTSVNPGQPIPIVQQIPIVQTIPIVQQMPVGQPIPIVQQVPLAQSIPAVQPIPTGQTVTSSTFGEYPMTTSTHGIKSNEAHPK